MSTQPGMAEENVQNELNLRHFASLLSTDRAVVVQDRLVFF